MRASLAKTLGYCIGVLTTAAVAGAASAETCQLSNVTLDHDPQRSQSGFYAIVTLGAEPTDVQRSVYGSAAIYYTYVDTQGQPRRASTISYFNDVIDDGDESVDIEIDIIHPGVFAGEQITRINSIRFMQVSCTY